MSVPASVEIVLGDITQQQADAIVNAANSSLLGGGGVDGAIHRAAGPGLLEECRALGGCETGQCKITKGHRLKSKWILHAVGPVWQGGGRNEDKLLADCYRHYLESAVQFGAKSIAFPSISTGAYGFPLERAASIASREIQSFLSQNHSIEKVLMVCFDPRTFQTYKQAFELK